MTETRKLAAILAADVVGFSRLAGADEDRTLARLRALRSDLIDPTIAVHHGRVVKRTGDGALVEFRSVVDAVRCAVEIQNAMVERNSGVPSDRRIEFRIGIHLGDVVEESDGDLMGDGVNIAARLEGIAQPGTICLSEDAYRQVRARLDLEVNDLGQTQLKNIVEPVRVYSLQVGLPAQAKSAASTTLTPSEKAADRLALPDRPSIAVLPFQNMSGDPEQEYFADGMVEDIITALSRFKELFVIARNSTFVYKARAVDVAEVARDLHVRYVLEGSVRRVGNRVRITGQLIDAATRAHLWADRFDGLLEDVFDLQDHITESVVGALAPTIRQAEIERTRRKPTENMDAYDYLLRALPHVLANSVSEAPEAIRLLTEAVRLDPDYALPHGYMATAYGQICRSALGEARKLARKSSLSHAGCAIALGTNDSAALACAAYMLGVIGQDMAGARSGLDRALALNPNSAMALMFRANVLALSGEALAAIADAEKAMRLSPLDTQSFLPQVAMAIAQIVLGENDAAASWARKAIRTNPRYPVSYVFLMVAECRRGNRAEAEAQLRQLEAIIADFGPKRLFALLNIYPPEIREASLATLRAAGFLAEG